MLGVVSANGDGDGDGGGRERLIPGRMWGHVLSLTVEGIDL
jgi:hypothetical protein